MKLRAIKTDILFSFVQEVKNGAFVNATAWGLEITNPVEDIKHARWGKVLFVGDAVESEDIRVNEYVLIEPLMWTTVNEIDGAKFWKTNESKIIATSSKMPENII